VGALVFGGERVSIRPGRSARDAPLVAVAGVSGGVVPGAVVGHRAFDGEDAPVVVAMIRKNGAGGGGAGMRHF
jgi:hypothetical protein